MDAVTRQIEAHDTAAQARAEQLQLALNGQTGQLAQHSTLMALNTGEPPKPVPAASSARLLTLRDQAAQKFPALLTQTTWIGEATQLVSPGQENAVTSSLTTLFVVVTADPVDPSKTVWVATVTANPETGEVYDTKLAKNLKGNYIPAWKQAVNNDNHIDRTRRVTTDVITDFAAQNVTDAPMLTKTRLAVYKTPYEKIASTVRTSDEEFAFLQRGGSEYALAKALGVDGVLITPELTTLLVKNRLSAQSLSSLSLNAQKLISSSKEGELLHNLSSAVAVQTVNADMDELIDASVNVIASLKAAQVKFSLTVGGGLINVGYQEAAQENAARQAVKDSGVDASWVKISLTGAPDPLFSWGSGPAAAPKPPENMRTRIEPLAGGAQWSQQSDTAVCSLGYSSRKLRGGQWAEEGFTTNRHCFLDRIDPSPRVFQPSGAGGRFVGQLTHGARQGPDTDFIQTHVPVAISVLLADHNTGNVIKRVPQIYEPSRVTPQSDIRLSGRTTGARRWVFNQDYINRQPIYLWDVTAPINYALDYTPMCMVMRRSSVTSGKISSLPEPGDSGGVFWTGSDQANLLGTLYGLMPVPGSSDVGVCWTTVSQHWTTLQVAPYSY